MPAATYSCSLVAGGGEVGGLGLTDEHAVPAGELLAQVGGRAVGPDVRRDGRGWRCRPRATSSDDPDEQELRAASATTMTATAPPMRRDMVGESVT